MPTSPLRTFSSRHRFSPLRGGCLAVTALLLALLLQPLAWAKDSRPVALPLTNGKSLTGVVEEGDAREIVVRIGPEEVRRIPWSRLAPLGYYRAKRALAPAADGKARQRLAELAVDLGFYVEAREEYEKALALGAIKKSKFKAAVAAAERDAVRNGVRYAERLAEAGDLEAAMEMARLLKLHFATAPNAREVSLLVAKLVSLVQTLDKEALKEKAEIERVVIANKREKEILRRKTKAIDLYKNAARLIPEWKKHRDRGSLSKARKIADKIDTMLQEARINLGRLRRILPRGHAARKDILAQLTQLDKSQFDLRLSMAETEKEATAWKRAELWAAKASYIDPVHPDLVELRDHLMTNRIRYRVSDITNARGRVSGP
jgi:tetratricopeptide (TPR) repeat protein